ncbi:MAG: polysaccharide deacetylase family protein [Victivallaceae bacterium]|nr:polysaccharide deacetylase family protein [Victivallaceae bacterium]
MTVRYTWPQWNFRALTFSYDDGVAADRKLVELFNSYGMKSTFHLNSALLDTPNHVSKSEVAKLYKGHEIACHTTTHPYPERIPETELLREVFDDRRALEALAKYPVRGMSYPFGVFDPQIIAICRAAGIVYSRSVEATMGFGLPFDFMHWAATCHHGRAMEILDNFLNLNSWRSLSLCYIWGHSYEFDNQKTWDMINSFCQRTAHLEGTWYATNMQIYRYVMAVRQLSTSADGRMFYNGSAETVWLVDNEDQHRIEPGETLTLSRRRKR